MKNQMQVLELKWKMSKMRSCGTLEDLGSKEDLTGLKKEPAHFRYWEYQKESRERKMSSKYI